MKDGISIKHRRIYFTLLVKSQNGHSIVCHSLLSVLQEELHNKTKSLD